MAPMLDDEDPRSNDSAPGSSPERAPTWAPDRLLDAEEVAEHLGMTAQWVYAQTRKGRIPHVKLGRYYRYQAASIDAWIAELERSEAAAAGSIARARPPRGARREGTAARTRRTGTRQAKGIGGHATAA